MKVKLNVTTNYNRQSLKLGDEIDIPLNVAQRWINKGIAHVVKEEVKPAVIVVKPVVKPVVKVVIPIVKEKVTEVDVIEPIPERFTSFEDKPKTSKPIWKPKISKSKKKNK